MITNIILDMDGTLLDHDILYNPIPRAYLKEFMEFVFETFERVSLWTAAGDDWFMRCYHDVLRHHIPEGKRFHFIKTRKDFDATNIVKPLSMIYAEYPDLYNPENTLIVDDNYATFVENIGNAVPVITFNYILTPPFVQRDLPNYDYELLDTIDVLRRRLGLDEGSEWTFRIPLSSSLY